MVGRSVAENITQVLKKIEAARHNGPRSAREVRLVAVSKTRQPSSVLEARAAGQTDFGENYVQELISKIDECADPAIRWHYIGALQRNKCKQIVGRVHLIHSVDRVELAQEISKVAAQIGRTQDILLQVKIGKEESKSGVDIENAEGVLGQIARLPNLKIKGLMTFPPLHENVADARRDFRRLADFLVSMKSKFSLDGFDDLSMGTSHDYEVAVEEGATIVRVGTEIFGERTP